ncbi:MAG: hypothetical protein HGA71_16520 [Azonexaceae bacterium]|nr:hypothetical protein [Azonexaceae bacterium]
MQFPIIIGLRRSRFLDALLLIVVVLACTAIFGFQCSPAIRAILFLAVQFFAIRALYAFAPEIKQIRLERNGEIFVSRGDESEFVRATPKPGAIIHPWLTVIRFATEDSRTATLIATVDRKSSENLRRLRMFMRWQASFRATNDDA